MEIKTKNYSNAFNTKYKLYAIQDFALPFPIALDVLGIVLAVAVPWFLILGLIFNYGMLSNGGISILIWCAPPGLLGYFAAQGNYENRSFIEFVKTQISFFITRGKWADLNSTEDFTSKGYQIDASYWERLEEGENK